MYRKIISPLSAHILFCLALTVSVKADPITFTIDNLNLNGVPGGTVSLTGRILNPLSVSVRLLMLPPLPEDDLSDQGFEKIFSGFSYGDALLQFPLDNDLANHFIIGPGQSSVGTLLTATLRPDLRPGAYKLLLLVYELPDTILLPPTPSDFPVNLNVTAAPIPEPATVLLLGTGLAGALLRVRGRRKRS